MGNLDDDAYGGRPDTPPAQDRVLKKHKSHKSHRHHRDRGDKKDKKKSKYDNADDEEVGHKRRGRRTKVVHSDEDEEEGYQAKKQKVEGEE